MEVPRQIRYDPPGPTSGSFPWGQKSQVFALFGEKET